MNMYGIEFKSGFYSDDFGILTIHADRYALDGGLFHFYEGQEVIASHSADSIQCVVKQKNLTDEESQKQIDGIKNRLRK